MEKQGYIVTPKIIFFPPPPFPKWYFSPQEGNVKIGGKYISFPPLSIRFCHNFSPYWLFLSFSPFFPSFPPFFLIFSSFSLHSQICLMIFPPPPPPGGGGIKWKIYIPVENTLPELGSRSRMFLSGVAWEKKLGSVLQTKIAAPQPCI